MCSHYSILAAGQTPHAPHAHVDEELLIVVRGEATLRYDDGSGAILDQRVTAGDGVYYPAFHRHTIHNHSEASVVYVMFKWIAPRSGAHEPLAVRRFSVNPIRGSDSTDRGFTTRHCFTGATHHLKKLHAHVSTLLPDASYDAHADEHDVALLIMEGRVKTLDRIVPAGALVWYAAREPHGMLNPGPEPARYIVFEFHGEGCSGDYAAYRNPRATATLFKRRGAARVLKNLKRIVGMRT
jgi:mannose-6-phosphate isomerase-like protein (cupin superfamily)